MRPITRTFALAGLVPLVFATVAGAQMVTQGAAQTFPNRAVKIVVPFPPGGSSDGSARVVAEKMSEEWKQPVLIENRPGAGTTIGAAYVAAAQPDGYTLLLVGPGTHGASAALRANLGYDAVKSFVGVAQLVSAPFAVVVNSSSKVNSLKELVELARAKPGQVSYSTSGSGAAPHLVTEMIALATGVKLLHVPFKGSAPATVALLAAQVEFSMADTSAVPHIQSGKMRGLAVTSASPSPLFRGLPTLAQAGVAGVEYTLTTGLLAPAGTPRDVVLRINAAAGRALAMEDVQRRLNSLGFEAAPRSADEFQEFFTSEVVKHAKIVRDINLKLD